MIKYPSGIDTVIELPYIVDNVTPVGGVIINNLRDAVVALENELGIKPSGIYANIKTRIAALEIAVANILPTTVTFGGDLAAATFNSQTVVGLQGNPVSSTAPTDGYLLTWSNVGGYWYPAPAPVGFSAGGDLSGTAISQTVNKLKGTTVTTAGGSLITGKVLRVTGSSTSDWGALDLANVSAVTGLLPIGNQSPQSMVGDVSGTTTASTVDKIKGKTLNSALSTVGSSQDGYVLTWVNGSTDWEAKPSKSTTVQNGSNYGSYLISPTFQPFSTASSTFINAACFEFDPTLIASANGARSITLRVIVETTTPQITIQLYNSTDHTIVTGSTLTSTSLTATELNTGDLTANLTNGLAIYFVQILMATGAVSDRVTLDYASLKIVWS